MTTRDHGRAQPGFRPGAGGPGPGSIIGRLCEAMAASTNEIVTGDGVTGVAELERMSAEVAAHLRAHGVAADVLVGLCVGRGIEMLAGMIGIWRAGGAYVPLDPTLPAERLRSVVEQCGSPLILTEISRRSTAEALAGGAAVLYLDEPRPAGAATRPAPVSSVSGENLAYVIHTSGSTGRPKGVMVPHGAVANLLGSFQRVLELGRDDTVLAATRLSFDISVLEVLLPLLCGSRLVVAGAEDAADGRALRGLVVDHGVTVVQATPAMWRLLMSAGGIPPAVRVRLCGGEAMPRDLAEALAEPGVALWNLYGPTETTVWSTATRMPRPVPPVTLGPPVDNTSLYVLDADLRPVPEGVDGELFIGGAGVVRGYLASPGLTAERFLPDPFAGRPGVRMYRTGDVAVRLSDDSFELRGRVDDQVKVRGFRVELGEVEVVLRGHPGVADAVVVPWVDGSGSAALVAYVVPSPDGGAPGGRELRSFVRRVLPEYMVPLWFVGLARLPLTAHGKVDRRALPDPSGHSELEVEFGELRTSTERLVAGIWSELLHVGSISAQDDFFTLGGHSMLALQVSWRLQEHLGTDVPPDLLFDASCLYDLAEAVDQLRAQEPAAQPETGTALGTQAVTDYYAEGWRL